MTLMQPPMMVHGGAHPARAMRLLLRDLARGRQGVAEASGMRVRPLETPGAGVRVSDGSAIVHGARPWQGAYAQTNIGDAVVEVEPTGPFARTDLLVLRVEDPEHEGTRDLASEDIGYFHLVTDVDRDADAAPDGMTALPLARITLPRYTSTITAGMISDLRRVINPRRERAVRTVAVKELAQLPGENGQWATWPEEAAWDLDIPPWATQARIIVHFGGLRIADGRIWAQLRPRLGERSAAATVVDDDQGTSARRITTMLADTLEIRAAERGSRQQLTVQTQQNTDYGTGTLSVAEGAVIACEVEFTEEAV